MKARRESVHTPYAQAYDVYNHVMAGGKTSLDDLALAVLVGITFVTTYFVAAVEAGKIKIGKTLDLPNRLCTLQTGSPVELKLAFAFKFDGGLESRLHEKLSAHRTHGEWFNASPEVIDTIKSIKRSGAAWVLDNLGEPSKNWADAANTQRGCQFALIEAYMLDILRKQKKA